MAARAQTDPTRVADTSSVTLLNVLRGRGLFDVRFLRPDRVGWRLFKLGQEQFWSVDQAVRWDEPWDEDPEVAGAIGAMLAFLTPGEKAAISGASMLSTMVRTEEARLYFVEQAMDEARHYEALRRAVPKLTGRPFPMPSVWTRALFSFGVLDRDDAAFMMGNINVVGEHIAHHIFQAVRKASREPRLQALLELISRDEARHIAAGQRFFPMVLPGLERHIHRHAARNMATTVLLLAATYDLWNPMARLGLHLPDVMEDMLKHYEQVTTGLSPYPRAVLESVTAALRRGSPLAFNVVCRITDGSGQVDLDRVRELAEEVLRSPRALRALAA